MRKRNKCSFSDCKNSVDLFWQLICDFHYQQFLTMQHLLRLEETNLAQKVEEILKKK